MRGFMIMVVTSLLSVTHTHCRSLSILETLSPQFALMKKERPCVVAVVIIYFQLAA
jgi:hypothetical protein